MSDRRTLVNLGIVAALLFLIEASLGFLLNLISADLESWYSDNIVLVLVTTGALIVAGSILTFAGNRFPLRQESDIAGGTSQTDDLNVLRIIYEAYRASPGDRVNSETIRQELSLSESVFIDLIKKLEEREFIRATWVGRKALLSITEDGVALLRAN